MTFQSPYGNNYGDATMQAPPAPMMQEQPPMEEEYVTMTEYAALREQFIATQRSLIQINEMTTNMQKDRRKEREDFRKKETQLNETIFRLTEEKERLEADIRDRTAMLRAVQEDYTNLQNKPREDKQKLESDLKDSRMKCLQMEARVGQAEEQMAAAIHEKDEKVAQFDGLNEQIRDLTARLQAAEAESAERLNRFNALRAQSVNTGVIENEQNILLVPSIALHVFPGGKQPTEVIYEVYASHEQNHHIYLAPESLEGARQVFPEEVKNGLPIIGNILQVMDPQEAIEGNRYCLPTGTPYRFCYCGFTQPQPPPPAQPQAA